jgi:subtilisin family serine protease
MVASLLVMSTSASAITADALESRAFSSQTALPSVITGQYIIGLKNGASSLARASVRNIIGTGLIHEYDDAFVGFAAELSDQQVRQLTNNVYVTILEPDRVVTTSGPIPSTVSSPTVQDNPPWGLDRIDQRDRPLNEKYSYDAFGEAVNVYVIDTGLNAGHSEFTGRVATGYSALTKDAATSDCHGHGTHVTGTAAGTTYGVAKKATIIPVKVLGCDGSGTTSNVIKGINWIIEQHVRGTKAVANLSLGGEYSSSLNTAIQNLHNAGVVVVVAAGNDKKDACSYSPASVASAITVGATDIDDKQATFSNFGPCLDLYAPGVKILSSYINSPTAEISGTSMAAPQICGLAALHLQSQPELTPVQLKEKLLHDAKTVVMDTTDSGSNPTYRHPACTNGSNNNMAYNRYAKNTSWTINKI